MARQNPTTAPQHVNMIGQGTTVEGTFQAKNDVRISGHVVGKVFIEGKAFLTQEGSIEGELKAINADIGGVFKGEIHARERVVLKGTARVDGDIHADRLVMEEGAIFNGRCIMGPGRKAEDVAVQNGDGKHANGRTDKRVVQTKTR